MGQNINKEVVNPFEVWKDITGFEGLYKVSSQGRIARWYKGWKHGKAVYPESWTIVKSNKLQRGYREVKLSRNGIVELRKRVHQLVAIEFIPNPENKPCVNHINGITNDNRVANLEWCTYSENELHSYRVLGKKANNPTLGKFGKLHHHSKPVLQFDLKGNFIKEFESICQVRRELGISTGNVCMNLRGTRKYAGGFVWKYKKLNEAKVREDLKA